MSIGIRPARPASIGGRHPDLTRWVLVLGAIGLLALMEAVLISRGSLLAYALCGALAVAIAGFVVSHHMYGVFLGWVALEGLAYPFLRYPLNSNVLTFDRFVLLALGFALLLTSGPPITQKSKRLAIAFGVFTAAYGVRVLFTDPLPLPPGRLPYSPLQPYLDYLDNVLLPFVVFLVALRTITPGRWRELARALSFLGVSLSALSLLQWVFGFELASLSGNNPFVDQSAGVVRVGGPYFDPSAYGSVMVVCIAATVFWMQREKAYMLGWCVLAIELLGLAPTYTKTVWGAGFVTVVLALGLRRRFSSRTVLVAFYSVTFLGVIFTLVQNSPVVQARVTSQASNDNFSGRLAVWQQALEILGQWPWFGAGAGQFTSAQQLVSPVYVHGVAAVPSPHNTFVAILAETGIVGFAALVFVLVAAGGVLRATRLRARTDEDGLFRASAVAGVVGCLLLSQTFTEIYVAPSMIFVGLLLGVVAGRLNWLGPEDAKPGTLR
jgi:O-antigen ligase